MYAGRREDGGEITFSNEEDFNVNRIINKYKAVFTATGFGIAFWLLGSASAMANLGGGTATDAISTGIGSVGNVINQVVNLTSGPIAKLLALVFIVGGAVMFARSGDQMHESIKPLAVAAAAIGILIFLMPLIGTNFTGALL